MYWSTRLRSFRYLCVSTTLKCLLLALAQQDSFLLAAKFLETSSSLRPSIFREIEDRGASAWSGGLQCGRSTGEHAARRITYWNFSHICCYVRYRPSAVSAAAAGGQISLEISGMFVFSFEGSKRGQIFRFPKECLYQGQLIYL